MSLIADRYELLEDLGHGGMASVHLARDRVLDRRIALKLLRADIGRDPVLRERFLREARLSANLTHANIVRVYDAGVDGDTPWIAMELVDGPSLREEMTRVGQMDAERAVGIITQVLLGLGQAHQAGVIHRDVKPGNVLLTRGGSADGAEEAKLGDFGIAKSLEAIGADLTQANQFMGTPKYIAPEVAIGLPASPSSDVYSAAVVLWEMLAGSPPFEHANPLSLAMMHRTDPVPPLRERRADVSPALVAAIETGLAKEPVDRPQRAADWAASLASALHGGGAATAATQVLSLPPPAPPPPPPAPPVREQTIALPLPAVSARRASPPPPARQSAGGRGVALVVAVLLVLAVMAFVVSREQLTDPGASPSTGPTVSVTPTPTSTEPVTAPTVAPTQPEPTTAPPPEPAPVPAAPAEPPPEPTPDPAPTETIPPPPEPTPAPTPLIDLFPTEG